MPNLFSPSDETAADPNSPAQTIGGVAMTSGQGGWRYPGFAAAEESSLAASSPADTIAGSAMTSCETEWFYPGCAPIGEPSPAAATETAKKPAWPYSSLGTQQPVVRQVTRIEEVVLWRYPGLPSWPATLVEVTETITEPAVQQPAASAPLLGEATQATYWPESTADEGYTIGTEPERVAASTSAPVRSPSAIRTGKRKKSKELNPLIMLVGVAGGGVVGLFLGYCILYVLMVKIMGRPGDFSNFWQ